MSRKKYLPWLIIILLAIIIAGLLLLFLVDTVLAPVLPNSSHQNRVEIYAAAIRKIDTRIQNNGGASQKGALYIRAATDDHAGDPSLKEPASLAISISMRDGLSAALADFPVKTVWLEPGQ